MAWTLDPTDPGAPGARALRLPVRGRELAALAWGDPCPGATVLLHGFLDHAGSWSRTVRHLRGPALALDLRGHGRSDWNGPGESYHFAEYIADLDAVVALLGGPVRLVGHSMGGTLASIYAGARPERVTRLAVVDGIGLSDGGSSARERMVQFLDGIGRVRGHRTFADVAEAAGRLVATWSVDPAHALELAARGTRRVDGGVAWSYDPRHRVRAPTPYRQDQHLRFLASLRCPVLSVHAARSLFSPDDVARLEGAIPDLRVATVDAGHMVQLEAPDALGDVLAAHLAGAGP